MRRSVAKAGTVLLAVSAVLLTQTGSSSAHEPDPPSASGGGSAAPAGGGPAAGGSAAASVPIAPAAPAVPGVPSPPAALRAPGAPAVPAGLPAPPAVPVPPAGIAAVVPAPDVAVAPAVPPVPTAAVPPSAVPVPPAPPALPVPVASVPATPSPLPPMPALPVEPGAAVPSLPVSVPVDVPGPAPLPTQVPGLPPAPAPDLTTAAGRYGWGTPLPASDEFNYVGEPDPAKWDQAGECWPGHSGNGRRCASRTTVDGSKLVQTGLAGGDTGWLASKFGQQYGRWELRVRSRATGEGGETYHPVLIVWPDSERWPQDGEYDFLENGAPGEDCAEAFLHYPHPPGEIQQEFVQESDCGAPLSEWHNVAFEWTPDHLKGFIDGQEWFSFSGGGGPNGRRDIQGMPSGHLTIQLDNFAGSGGLQPASFEVDWVRIYKL